MNYAGTSRDAGHRVISLRCLSDVVSSSQWKEERRQGDVQAFGMLELVRGETREDIFLQDVQLWLINGAPARGM